MSSDSAPKARGVIPRTRLDWDAMRQEFRLGASVVSIAAKHGCTQNTVYRKVSEQKWTRDPVAQVRLETEKRLIASSTDAEPSRADIETAAGVNVAVIHAHRVYLGKMQEAANNLSNYLVKESKKKKPDVAKLSGAMVRCAQAMHRMIPLERQAFNIDAKGGAVTLEDALKALDDGA